MMDLAGILKRTRIVMPEREKRRSRSPSAIAIGRKKESYFYFYAREYKGFGNFAVFKFRRCCYLEEIIMRITNKGFYK